MKTNTVLWMSMLVLLLTACSSNDDDNNSPSTAYILGYWENTGENLVGANGLVFLANGEVKDWYYDVQGQDAVIYHEDQFGYFWLDEDGQLVLSSHPRNTDSYPDEMYYAITDLSADRLVVRSWGGFFYIPYDKGHDTVYRKMQFPPNVNAQ